MRISDWSSDVCSSDLCAIAHALGIPCIDVVHEYDRHPGQGWGVVAKRLGIKPGSAAFHALKRGQVDTYRRWGQTIVVDRPVHVDWSRSGPGRGRADNRHDRGGSKGTPARGNDAARGRASDHGNSGNQGKSGNKSNNDKRPEERPGGTEDVKTWRT